jgi:hypothetical protein
MKATPMEIAKANGMQFPLLAFLAGVQGNWAVLRITKDGNQELLAEGGPDGDSVEAVCTMLVDSHGHFIGGKMESKQ